MDHRKWSGPPKGRRLLAKRKILPNLPNHAIECHLQQSILFQFVACSSDFGCKNMLQTGPNDLLKGGTGRLVKVSGLNVVNDAKLSMFSYKPLLFDPPSPPILTLNAQ